LQVPANVLKEGGQRRLRCAALLASALARARRLARLLQQRQTALQYRSVGAGALQLIT
jgi:hypothetical protein